MAAPGPLRYAAKLLRGGMLMSWSGLEREAALLIWMNVIWLLVGGT